jgi:hypothetical protein
MMVRLPYQHQERCMLLPWDEVLGHFDLATLLISALVALLIAAYSPRGMRALALWVAQYAAFVALVLAAAMTGRLGHAIGTALAQAHGMNNFGQINYGIAGAAAGGLLGFAAGALMLSIFFALLDIRERTRA